MAKHDHASQQKAERNALYAARYRLRRCKDCGHKSSRLGRCKMCGGKKRTLYRG